MAYTAAELSGPVQFGDDKKLFFYDASDSSDTIATVLASGYFNNSDDNIRMAVDDQIQVKATDGVYMLQVTASTGGAVTTTLLNGDIPIEAGSTTSNIKAYGLTSLDASTGAARTYNMDVPARAGVLKYLLANSDTNHTVTSTAGFSIGTTGATSLTIIGSGTVGNAVALVSKSTTQYLIVARTGISTGEVALA